MNEVVFFKICHASGNVSSHDNKLKRNRLKEDLLTHRYNISNKTFTKKNMVSDSNKSNRTKSERGNIHTMNRDTLQCMNTCNTYMQYIQYIQYIHAIHTMRNYGKYLGNGEV